MRQKNTSTFSFFAVVLEQKKKWRCQETIDPERDHVHDHGRVPAHVREHLAIRIEIIAAAVVTDEATTAITTTANIRKWTCAGCTLLISLKKCPKAILKSPFRSSAKWKRFGSPRIRHVLHLLCSRPGRAPQRPWRKWMVAHCVAVVYAYHKLCHAQGAETNAGTPTQDVTSVVALVTFQEIADQMTTPVDVVAIQGKWFYQDHLNFLFSG